MWETVACWIKSHEALAIWIEGIALVLILAVDTAVFIVALRDRRRQHEESAAQMEIMQSHADATRNAAIAAKDSAEAVVKSERAWLLVSPTLPNLLRVGSPNVLLTFKWAIKNVGRTPGRIIETDATVWRVKDMTTIPASPKYEGKPVSLNRFLLVPNDSLGFGAPVEPFGDPFTSEEVHGIAHHKLTLFAYGYVKYLDNFEREHTTRFCQTYIVRTMDVEGFEPYWNAPPEYTQCD